MALLAFWIARVCLNHYKVSRDELGERKLTGREGMSSSAYSPKGGLKVLSIVACAVLNTSVD